MIWWLTGVSLALLWCWWAWREVPEDPMDVFDSDYPASAPPIDSDFGCPDTEPTSPGALDSDLGRLR